MTKANARGRFVAISDLHAHPWAAFSKGDGAGNSRLARTLGVLRASLNAARAAGVPWVFAGDIVHTAGYALNVVLSALISVLEEYPDVPKIVVWGNHDARGVGGLITLEETVWAAILKSVPNLYVLDPSLPAQAFFTCQGLTFGGAGSQPKAQSYDVGTCDVGIYHGIVQGSTGPNGFVFEDGLDPDVLADRHRISVVGDLHHPQFRQPQKGRGILVPGSPEHHNFGDAGPHGWWMVSLENGDVSAKLTPSDSPRFLTVDTVSEVMKDDGCFYRVRSVGAGELVPEGVEVIKPAPTVVEARAAMSGMSDEEIIEAWLTAAPPPEDGPNRSDYFATGRELLRAQERVALRPSRWVRLRLRNFGSYKEQEFPVTPGVHLVLGAGRDFDSNGAGKSTLFEAAYWLLTGKTTKGLSGDEVIRRDQSEDCSVEGELEFPDGVRVTVIRSRGESGHTLRAFNAEGDSVLEAAGVIEATKALLRWLGVTQELLQMTSYLSQEGVTMFSSVTDGPRKEMVGALIGLGAYQEASATAGEAVRSSQKTIDSTSAVVARLESGRLSELRRLEEATALEAEWEGARAQRFTVAEANLAEHLAEEEAMLQEVEAEHAARAMAGLEKRLAALVTRKQELESLDFETNLTVEQAEQLVTAAEAAYGTVLADSVRASSAAEHAKKLVVRLQAQMQVRAQKLAAGICPECEQSIDPSHAESCLVPFRADLEAALGEAANAALGVPAAAEAARQAEVALRAARDDAEVAKHAAARDANLLSVQQDLIAIEAERIEAGKLAAEQARVQVEGKRAALEGKVEVVRAEQNPHTARCAEADARMRELHAEIVEAQSQMVEHQQSVLLHGYWQQGFSRSGVQSLLLDELAAGFNEARGGVFPALTQGVYDAQLSTQSKTKGGELREKTEILVYEHGKEVPYAGLSGGERQRIDVGVMLTLIKAISSWMQVPGVMGWLVLDEVFKFLDISGAEGLAEALREVQEVVPSVYVVTHDPQFQALFSNVLRVQRREEDGVSEIVA